jgi:hypothetical protein
MPTALEVGLVPGFALQDGDLIARLLGGGGAGNFGLGNTVSGDVDISGSGDNNPDSAYRIMSSVTVITSANSANNSIMLTEVPPLGILRIYNETPEALYIFPPAGQNVDGDVTDQPVWLSGGARCDYLYLGNGTWITDLLGTKSA